MTTTTPTKSAEKVGVELAEKEALHQAAVVALDAARDERQRIAEGLVLGLADSEERAAAVAAENAAMAQAEKLAADVETWRGALAKAMAAEREAEQARRAESHPSLLAGYRKVLGRHDRHLTTVAADDEEINDFLAQMLGNRSRYADALDRTDEIHAELQRDYERLRREAPPGQTVNVDTLERREATAIDAMRASNERQVDEALPLPDPAELSAIRARHSSLAPLLLEPELRRAIAEGFEFVGPVQSQNAFSRPTFVGRLYASHEFPEAERRRDAFLSALRVLASPADRIGAETLKYPGGTAVQAA